MALIKKCDVNDYFAAKRHARLHPLKPANKPASKPSGFARDFLGEHSTPKKPIEPGADDGYGAL
jgi:hypothetical protein